MRDPMDLTPRETPEAYAQRRANETRQPYLVTGMGHVWTDRPSNRIVAQICEGIAAVFTPQKEKRRPQEID
jgi:poly(3-hydroxybutyrate) depolymerase